ncbi:hypothetical protein LLEC1_07411 [Akanthomyces lecanii]|uniref:Glutamine repeat protein-1 n=1 Tax=Cordyceps confragosa TaxID=2714763 RepID=A0A179I757_CORDF|nr:hypothetical protein LLEC1_07411 [Akanthomyces lecanii]
MFQGQFGGYGNAGPQFNQQAGAQPNQQQQQQMMFNQQQFAGMAPQGGFNPAANPQMMAGASQGMMQNPGMPNMAANGQMAGFQQQFSPQQYGQVPQNFAQQQYMMGGMQGFPMNQQGMTQQQAQQIIQQRLQQQQQHIQQQQAQQQQHAQQQHAQQQQAQQHPPQQQQHPQHQQHQQPQQHQNPQAQQHHQHQQLQQHHNQQLQQQHSQQPNMSQVGTPQRPPSAAQNSPAGQMPGQPQFSPHQMPQGTPQPGNQMQQQPQQHQQQMQQPGAIATPQTPTFPGNQGPNAGVASNVPPLSPASESREKERFALLLDINHELLYEVILLQGTQTELKKETAALNGSAGERKSTEEEALFQQDYVHCMRRLQANLSYMAAQADRKAETKGPPYPGYMTAPPLNLSLRPRAQPMSADGPDAKVDPVTDREDRDKAIKDLYRRLQAAYPGVDFKKESAARLQHGQKAGNAAGFQGSPIAQKTPQIPNAPPPQVS